MYKLCGGTLLVLLVHSGKKGTTETSLLSETLKVFKSDLFIDNCTLKEQTKKFKLCKEHSSLATPFEDASIQIKLANEINNNYNELLKRTSEFINNSIDTDPQTNKDEVLVKALLEVIEKDNSIPNQQKFYILPNGKSVKKSILLSMTKFYLPSFLLGILYYVILNIKDNKEGAETYNEWCPKPKSGTQRKYIANIGETSTKQISLLNSPDEYSYHELLELADEAITFFVKKIHFNDDYDYDIATTPIIFSDNIDSCKKDDYIEFLINSHDYHYISSFINDFNNLISYTSKYQNSNNKEDINILGYAKQDFFRMWISFPRRFDNNSVQEWFRNTLDKIEKSKIIDINNVTICPKIITPDLQKIFGDQNHLSQKTHYKYLKDEEKDQKQKNDK
jgi:hypothetical protein